MESIERIDCKNPSNRIHRQNSSAIASLRELHRKARFTENDRKRFVEGIVVPSGFGEKQCLKMFENSRTPARVPHKVCACAKIWRLSNELFEALGAHRIFIEFFEFCWRNSTFKTSPVLLAENNIVRLLCTQWYSTTMCTLCTTECSLWKLSLRATMPHMSSDERRAHRARFARGPRIARPICKPTRNGAGSVF